MRSVAMHFSIFFNGVLQSEMLKHGRPKKDMRNGPLTQSEAFLEHNYSCGFIDEAMYLQEPLLCRINPILW